MKECGKIAAFLVSCSANGAAKQRTPVASYNRGSLLPPTRDTTKPESGSLAPSAMMPPPSADDTVLIGFCLDFYVFSGSLTLGGYRRLGVHMRQRERQNREAQSGEL